MAARLTEQRLLTGWMACCGGQHGRNGFSWPLAETGVMKPEQYRRGKRSSSVAGGWRWGRAEKWDEVVIVIDG